MGLKRRDFLVGSATAAALGGAAYEEASTMKIDGQDVTDDEKDLGKQVIAVFLGSFPAGGEPAPEQIADRARLAIRAWRLIEKNAGV